MASIWSRTSKKPISQHFEDERLVLATFRTLSLLADTASRIGVDYLNSLSYRLVISRQLLRSDFCISFKPSFEDGAK